MLRSPVSAAVRQALSAVPEFRRRGGAPTPAAPINTSLPVISGSPTVGSTLSASIGSWTGYPAPTYARQWRRGGVNIGGATGATYVVQAADYLANIDCVVTATNTQGSAGATAAAAAIVASAPVNTAAPVISGATDLGAVLTVTSGTWSGYPAPSFARQWLRNGVNIAGATASTYTVAVADSGATITCVVTATNAGGSSAQASNGITAQTFTAPTISGIPTISGASEVGQILAASPSSASGNPPPARTWQWLRDGANIAGATNSTYTLVTADGGTNVSVRQIETNALGADDAVSSALAIDEPPLGVITIDSTTVSMDGTSHTFDIG